MQYKLLAIALLCSLHTNAQTKDTYYPPPPPDSLPKGAIVYTYVEQMPTAPFNMATYLNENLHYPKEALVKNIQGRVIVKFIITEKGAVDSAIVVKGIGWGCDEEALRVVNNMPRWKPGTQSGKPVKVFFNLPIVFKLN